MRNADERNESQLQRLNQRFGSSGDPNKQMSGGRRPMGPGGGGRHRMATGKPKDAKATILRLFGYFKGKWGKVALVFVAMLIHTLSTVAGSYLLRPIINNLIAEGVSAADRVIQLSQGLIVLGLIYIVGVVSTYVQQLLMISVSQDALVKIRSDLFVKLQRLSVGYYDRHNTGDLMSRFTNDVDNIGNMLNSTLTSLVSGVVTLIGTLIMMLVTNVWLTLITVVFLPIFTLGGMAISKASRKYFKAQQDALGTLNGYMEEMVSGQKVVKVFEQEDQAKEDFSVLNDDLRQKQLFANFFGGIMGPVMGNTSQISYAITACVGGILCVTNGFDVGGLTVFVGYSRQFSRPINEISMQMNVIFSALAGAERVFKVMDEPEEPETGTIRLKSEEVKGSVVLENVTFGYLPEQTVLKNISLWAKPGQKIAFVGSTGAGKTTITNLLNRFYRIREGKITIDGVDIYDIETDSLRQNIAMVLQDTHLFTATVMENIRYGRLDATDEEVIAAAKTASAHSFIKHLPNGYQTMIEGDGANLSQGQRQLLNIARAAVSKAPILILDEATSSVDTRTERHIEKGMDSLMENRTTFVIAHRLSTVRNANAIMVLEHGEIIERGDHNTLLEQKGRYYELYTGKRKLD